MPPGSLQAGTLTGNPPLTVEDVRDMAPPEVGASVPVSAIIPAHRRFDELRSTLQCIRNCRPQPSEIIVHADGGSRDEVTLVTSGFGNVKVLCSDALQGPGGSRGRMIQAASNVWAATFDDDSHPLDQDYFARIVNTANRHPHAAVFSAVTIHDPLLPVQPDSELPPNEVFVFSGCGCVFNKTWYERTQGYVPVPVAYGMEEVDLSLQLHALGGVILEVPGLRVCHKDPWAAMPSDMVLAYSIANIALLGFLRFPMMLWPLIPLQLLSRIIWVWRRGWTRGLWRGLRLIPAHLRTYASYRAPLPAIKILSWLRHRHTSTP